MGLHNEFQTAITSVDFISFIQISSERLHKLPVNEDHSI